MTPFEQWFSSDYQRDMREVASEPGLFSSGFDISGASWDRKAAFLLWEARGRPAPSYHSLANPAPTAPAAPAAAPDPMEDVLG